ncbi:MAG TPA: Zn-binding domain-containing protein, partial [Thermoanaerobaculia bacterium]|nr:Zn-binding domain-containing protein [Thermoanaerobaculia bacterium]
VSLRGGGETFAIVQARGGRTIGTIDGLRVYFECHPGAIYLHAGRQYLVRELDLGASRVLVEPTSVDWYTTALAEKDTRILEATGERHEGALSAWLGRLRVTERVVGYERKRIFGGEVLSRHELELPEVSYETVGVWWAATPAIEAALGRRHAGEVNGAPSEVRGPHHFLGSLHAAEHAAISLLPLLALCDRGDLGGISTPFHPQIGCGGVFVYEGHAGGVGIAPRAFAALPELLARVGRLLDECPCESGCPSCVQSPKCGNGNRPLDKAGARRVVALLLGDEALPAAEPWRLSLEVGAEVAADGDDEHELPPVTANGSQLPSVHDNGRHSAASGNGSLLPSSRGREAAAAISTPNGHRPFSRLAASLRSLWRDVWRRRAPRVPALPPTAGGDTLLFDLETLRSAAEVGGWGNAHRMGIALAVICRLEEERFEVYRERDARALAATLRAARLVIGFNVRRFDYRVLAGYTGADYNRLVPTLDLLEDVHHALGFRLRLDHLARETLGNGKTADGLQSLAWVREGRFDLVEEYCRHDVEVLRDLYLFGRREGYVMWRDREERRMRLPVRW